jgi:hypothetical protein
LTKDLVGVFRELEMAKTIFESLGPNSPALFWNATFCSSEGSNNDVALTRDLVGIIRELELATTAFESLDPKFSALFGLQPCVHLEGPDNNFGINEGSRWHHQKAWTGEHVF